jgi:hypothetical protein
LFAAQKTLSSWNKFTWLSYAKTAIFFEKRKFLPLFVPPQAAECKISVKNHPNHD